MRGQKTTKTGCEWKLSVGPGDGDGRWKVLKGHLEHNHPITPDKYSLLDERQASSSFTRC